MARTSLCSTLLPLFLLLTPVACSKESGSPQGSTATNQVQPASPEETKKLVEQGATLVDVREQDEVADGKIASALEFPFSSSRDNGAWTKFMATLSKDKPVVLYCASGGRAQRLGERLAKEGFKVHNGGGYDALAKVGLPTKKP